MFRLLQLLAIAHLSLVLPVLAFADKKEEEPAKADVIVKDGDKSATAKPGQVVQVEVKYPVIPPFPDGFVVKVDGKKVDSKTFVGVVLSPEGKPVVGVGLKLVQFKAAGAGKQKVVVEYKKGKDDAKFEIDLEIAK